MESARRRDPDAEADPAETERGDRTGLLFDAAATYATGEIIVAVTLPTS